jgi:hypothetical protein
MRHWCTLALAITGKEGIKAATWFQAADLEQACTRSAPLHPRWRCYTISDCTHQLTQHFHRKRFNQSK